MNNGLFNLPTETVEICVNCQLGNSARDTTFEDWLCLKPPYQVRSCEGCGLRWLSPRPTSVGYETVYSTENYFSSDASNNFAYSNFLNARNANFKKRIATFDKHFVGKKNLKILDYGAATGEFVAIAINAGYDCVGMEFSAEARKIAAEKNKIALLSPTELPEINVLFDVVHMNHVFEHMPDPAEHLVWCCNHMASDGLLIIEVPQQFNNHIDRMKRLLGRGGKFETFSSFSLHHTYFFNSDNIKQLIERNGFEVSYLSTNVVGPRLGGKPTFKTKLMGLFSLFADILFKGGDNIEIFARLKKVSL